MRQPQGERVVTPPARESSRIGCCGRGRERIPKLAKTLRKAEPLPPLNKALEPFVSALADLIIADLRTRPLRVSDEKK